jgi:hypothetical protein
VIYSRLNQRLEFPSHFLRVPKTFLLINRLVENVKSRSLPNARLRCKTLLDWFSAAGMLNHGVLALHVPLPGLRRRPLLTTTVTYVLRLCLLDPMFDDHFEVQPVFMRDGRVIAARFRVIAAVSAVLCPFILLFLLMHFALKHLERIYHHPASLGASHSLDFALFFDPSYRLALRVSVSLISSLSRLSRYFCG